MAHRRSFRSGRGISDSQRRKKAWIDMNAAPGFGEDIAGGSLGTATLGAPGEDVGVLVFPSSTNQAFAESTILRIRGVLNVPKSTSVNQADMTSVFAFGIGIISEQASEVLTAIPNPATASGWDWDGWMFLRNNYTTPVDPAGEIVDVKAMRKWHSGDSIVFVAGVATSEVAGEVGQIFQFSLRGLFLLP